MSEFSEIMITLAVQHLWQSAVLTILLFLMFEIYPRQSHEIRSWLWLSVFMLAVLMPLLIFLPVGGSGGVMQNFLAETFAPVDNRPAVTGFHINFYVWGLVLWAIGTVFQTVRLCRSAFYTRRIINAATALPEAFTVFAPDRDYSIYCSSRISGPMVTGFFRQVILLPGDMVTRLSPDIIGQILYHEYAHIQRNDIRIMLVQKILSALYWWNPVLHLMVRGLNQSREMACDERAVLHSNNIRNYTRSLLSSAEHVLVTRQSPLMVGIFHNRRNLTQRIERLKTMNIKMIGHSKTTSLLWSISLISVTLVAGYMATPRLALAGQVAFAGEQGRNLFPVSKTAPVYPKQAVEQKLEGYVIVKFDILTDGTTANVTIQDSSDKIFNKPTITAARSFVYKPQPGNKVVKNVLHKIVYELGDADKH